MKPYEVVAEEKGIRIIRNPDHPRNIINAKLKEKPLESMSKGELLILVKNYMQLNE